MYQEINNIKWVKCWVCDFPIVVQVGNAIPVGATTKCPRCGKLRSISNQSFINASDIPERWKKEVLKSIGVKAEK